MTDFETYCHLSLGESGVPELESETIMIRLLEQGSEVNRR